MLSGPDTVRRLCVFAAAGYLAASSAIAAPLPDADPALDRGFTVRVNPEATAEEVLGQPGFWALEVDLKPLRIVKIARPDGTTDVVYYLVYRVAQRDLLAPTEGSTDDPVNNYDDAPGPERFIPRFTLISLEDDRPAAYPDVIDPLAFDAIVRREMRGPLTGVPLRNSVEISLPLPEHVAVGVRPSPDQYYYGVAVWPEVDAEVDRFRIVFDGFSNGYTRTEGGGVARRVFRQDFWRPGDGFDRAEREFRFAGDPQWSYAPDDAE